MIGRKQSINTTMSTHIKNSIAFLVLILLLLIAGTVWLQKFNSYPQATIYLPITTKTSPPEKTTTLTFGGDLMFDRMINHVFKNKGTEHVFDNIDKDLFSDADIAMSNLEGPISPDAIDDNITADRLIFEFPSDTITALESLGLDAVSLANNHTANAGKTGLVYTQTLLSEHGIVPIGEPSSYSARGSYKFDTNIPVRIFAINMLDNPDTTVMVNDINQANNNGEFVIVYPHWGVEYQTQHSSGQERLAHQWIDAGLI